MDNINDYCAVKLPEETDDSLLDDIIDNIVYFNPDGQTITKLWIKINERDFRDLVPVATKYEIPCEIYDLGIIKGQFLDFDVYYHDANSEDQDLVIIAWQVDGNNIYRVVNA